ncbi:MAG: 3-deoxy-manno-octulosonate cytidylyltransferase [Sphingomonas fennica]
MADLIVIPARYGSSRLPAKPLLPIAGTTLLHRMIAIARAAARLAGGIEVVVATDDARIADHAAAVGCAVALTDPALASGSDRVRAVAADRAGPDDLVMNLQGDAPFTPPAMAAAVLAAARARRSAVATPVIRLDWAALDRLRAQKAAAPFSGTTCIRAADGRALWFSKTILPAIRGEEALRAAGPLSPVWRHVGLYVYRRAILDRFAALPPSPYELLEGLEQLRLLEADIPIDTVAVDPPPIAMSGIDAPADLIEAERLVALHGDPHEPL